MFKNLIFINQRCPKSLKHDDCMKIFSLQLIAAVFTFMGVLKILTWIKTILKIISKYIRNRVSNKHNIGEINECASNETTPPIKVNVKGKVGAYKIEKPGTRSAAKKCCGKCCVCRT